MKRFKKILLGIIFIIFIVAILVTFSGQDVKKEKEKSRQEQIDLGKEIFEIYEPWIGTLDLFYDKDTSFRIEDYDGDLNKFTIVNEELNIRAKLGYEKGIDFVKSRQGKESKSGFSIFDLNNEYSGFSYSDNNVEESLSVVIKLNDETIYGNFNELFIYITPYDETKTTNLFDSFNDDLVFEILDTLDYSEEVVE